MPWLNLDMHPWCTGRGYCNCDGRWKIKTIGRPPPYWWMVQIAEIDPDPLGINGIHICRPSFNQLDWEPDVQWGPIYPWFGSSQLEVGWLKHPTAIGNRYLAVNLRYGNSEGERTIWAAPPVPVVNDWALEYDDTPLGVIYRPPTWTHGDATCQLRIGTYARMPANSCRGDYGGEWP